MYIHIYVCMHTHSLNILCKSKACVCLPMSFWRVRRVKNTQVAAALVEIGADIHIKNVAGLEPVNFLPDIAKKMLINKVGFM
jgi:hypothetical protein